MENRAVNSNGAEITKKPRSLDLKTLYKSSISNDEHVIRSLKRKGTSQGGDDVKQKNKKSRKAVLLSSFKDNDSFSGKNLGKACNGGIGSHSLTFSEPELHHDLRNGDSSCGTALHFEDSLARIPKRKRRFLRKNKFETGQAPKPARSSGNEPVPDDQRPIVTNEVAGAYAPSSNARAKQVSDDSKVNGESDSRERLKVEDRNGSDLAEDNSDAAMRVPVNNHRKRDAVARDSESVREKAEPPVHISGRVCNSAQEYDEENLEANAARMLSSRFDPSCTGFLVDNKASVSTSGSKLPLGLFSGKKSNGRKAKHFKTESTSLDDNRVLRPRTQLKEKGATRKRRHFYELLSENLDAHWLLNRRIKVFWPLDESWYYGLVNEYDNERKLHHVKYDDRDEEWINLQNERFKILLFPSEVPGRNGRRRSRNRNKPLQKVKGDGESGKNKERRSLEDDSCAGNSFESEPIISWLARLDRSKFPSRNSAKKQRTSAASPVHSLLPSNTTLKSENKSDVEDSLFDAGSLSSHGMGDCGIEYYAASGSSMYPKDRKVHIVYYRRRFHKRGKTSCQLTEVPGELKALTTLTTVGQFKFEICFPVLSVLNLNLGAESCWLFHAIYLLSHGTLVTVLPRVCLEMLFLDNLVGLRFFLFEGCLKEAVRLIFQALSLSNQFEDQGEYVDLRLPVTSIGVRVSCTHNPRKHIECAFYNFSLLRNLNWAHLDRKVKSCCLYTRLLAPSECTKDNIKSIQNSQLLATSVCDDSSTIKGPQKRSSRGIDPTSASRTSSLVNLGSELDSSGKRRYAFPLFVHSFSSPATFLLGLHLKMAMENSSSYIKSLGHASLEPVMSDNWFITDLISSTLPKNYHGTGTRASQENATCISVISTRTQSGNVNSSNYSDQNEATSPQKCKNGNPNNSRCSSSFHEPEGNGGGVPEPKLRLLKSESGKSPVLSNISVNDHRSCTSPVAPGIEVPQPDQFEDNAEAELPGIHQSADQTYGPGLNNGPNPTPPRSTLARSRSNSSTFGQPSHGWSDQKADLLQVNFRNGPKKPRTQVSYSLPSGGFDSGSRNKGFQRGPLPKRIRKSNDRRLADVSSGTQKNLDLLSCTANVLVTLGDRGWRECGAQIVLELFDHNEWKLAVKVSGSLRYSYKAHQFLQPGTTNRYTHAMMWKGGKDWILEFPDRTQWFLFKEMHEECYNRNVRASSVRNIPIPGVRLIEENDDNAMESAFVRSSSKYYRQIENDVEMALDSSRMLYDMDSDDEQWIRKILDPSYSDNHGLFSTISENVFEKAMDMFEKAAYVQQHDNFSSNEIEELTAGVGPKEAVERIYEHWKAKRQRKGMPLIRHLQPPLWQRYQQQLKEWELATGKTTASSPNGSHQKATPVEKPPMFAFCLKPRGLEVPNKGSKHRSQKKLSVFVQNNFALGDQEGLHHTSGRRLNGFPPGDERCIYPGYYYESLEDYSPLSQTSPWMFSRDPGAGYFSLSSVGYERNYQQRPRRSKSKKYGAYGSFNDTHMATSYNSTTMCRRNGIDRWTTSPSGWLSPRNHYNDYQRLNPEDLDDAGLDELRLRDAAGAAKHARNVARLKRERAEKLHYRADVAIQKAMVAIMTAEAIKASSGDLGDH